MQGQREGEPGSATERAVVERPSQKPTAVQRALKRLARLALSVSFRRVDVVGSLPDPDRPAIIAVNHTNGLGDAVVVLARTPGFPSFLAAASWWKFAPARWLFGLAGVLPIHRRREGEDTDQNTSSFAACEAALAAGRQIAIHPEGEMHAGTALLPLRTGAARIALGAAAHTDTRELSVIPYGIVYEDRGRFRSDATLNIGAPIPVDGWVREYRRDPEPAVRAFTNAIAEGLSSVTANHESAEGARVIAQAAILTLRDRDELAERESGYGHRHLLIRQLAIAIDAVGGESSEPFQQVEAAVNAHRVDLGSLGIGPDSPLPHLEQLPDSEKARRQRELGALTPIAAVGAMLNAPVALALVTVGRFVRDDGWQATTRGALGVVLCPIVWALEAEAISRVTNRRVMATIAVTLAAPLGGWASLAWYERSQELRRAAWHDRVASQQPAELNAARSSRARVRVLVESILASARAGDDDRMQPGVVGAVSS